jgi:hypothetical protein
VSTENKLYFLVDSGADISLVKSEKLLGTVQFERYSWNGTVGTVQFERYS